MRMLCPEAKGENLTVTLPPHVKAHLERGLRNSYARERSHVTDTYGDDMSGSAQPCPWEKVTPDQNTAMIPEHSLKGNFRVQIHSDIKLSYLSEVKWQCKITIHSLWFHKEPSHTLCFHNYVCILLFKIALDQSLLYFQFLHSGATCR